MSLIEWLFWISILIVFYTYLGYPLLLFVVTRSKKRDTPSLLSLNQLPSIALIIAAYNEEDVIGQKLLNSLALDYPPDKLDIIVATDGSSDDTPHLARKFDVVTVLHQAERRGKIHAVERAMQFVHADLTAFTDANTLLNNDALLLIARHFADPLTGAVAGEKKVMQRDASDAAAGEGFYWKYESQLKRWDAQWNTVVGAAGELFCIRTSLYEPVPEDTILDDFMISLRIAGKGYRVAYEPAAQALEMPSLNIREELKRKVRIAAGGIQSIARLKNLLNPFHQPLLTFQYISHRVLRWTLTPLMLISAWILNVLLCLIQPSLLYGALLSLQTSFYLIAAVGYMAPQQAARLRGVLIPCYFTIMNYAVLAGMMRYFRGRQSVAWERSKRQQE